MLDMLNELSLQATGIAAPGQCVEILPGAELLSANATTCRATRLYEPMACIVLQGAMEVTIGQNVLTYGDGSCFVSSMDLPVTSRIIRASPERPHVALTLALDRDGLANLLEKAPEVAPERRRSYAVEPVPAELLDACRRLLALAAAPEDVAVIGPMIRTEIQYRLLRGPQAAALHQIVGADPKFSQVRRALAWIRGNLDQSIPVLNLATCAGMSETSFRRHFRTATGMSPLQYQKTLRLQAARRAILAGSEISRAAFAVGYVSASQFSREYARLFGFPPSTEFKRLQERSVA